MMTWTVETARQTMDEGALVDSMHARWLKKGQFGLVPQSLLAGLQPAFTGAFNFAAQFLLGRLVSMLSGHGEVFVLSKF